MRRRLAFLALLPIASLCLAQTKVRLEFPSEAERVVWAADGYGTSAPADADPVEGKVFEYSAGKGSRLFIWDKSTGNLADKPLKDLKGAWKVASSDFKRVARVILFVNHDGKALASGHVTVRQKGSKPAEFVLDSKAGGTIELWAAPPGQLDVEAQYRTLQGKTGTSSVTFKLAMSRDEAVPRFPVTVLDDVETVAGKSDPQAPPPKKQQESSGGGGFGTLMTYLLAIGFAVGAVFLILHILKGKEGFVKDRLEALGVQVPDPAKQDPSDPLPAIPTKPEPPQKIILDDAAPVPPPTALDPYVPEPIPSTADPKLVGENGSEFEIAEGLSTVGREAGLPVSLEGESTVSRQHAEIVRSAGVVTLTDLGSTNGTFVNGVKVEAEVTLRPGDQVQFGAVKFRFQ